MDSKEMLLRKISTSQFAAWELHIYLDTHPNDKQAIESYADYEQLVGGVETLFGTGGKTIEEYAKSVGKPVKSIKKEYIKKTI